MHFTRAAERLCIGQPPLSYAIAQLETEIGALLFARTKRSVQLTEAGKLLWVDAKQILALADAAARTARLAATAGAGELRIGFTSSTPLTELFSAVVQLHRQRFAAVSLKFSEMSTEHQLQALQNRQLDLAFLRPQYGKNPQISVASELMFLHLRTDPLVVVLPVHHPLAGKSHIALTELANEGFIMYPAQAGTSIYNLLSVLCLQAGFTPRTVQQAGEASTIIGLVAAGIGISILPACFDRIRLDGVCYRPLAEPAAVTSLLLAYHQQQPDPQKQALIAQFVALTGNLRQGEQTNTINPTGD